MRFFVFFVWALGLSLPHTSFGVAILDTDSRRVEIDFTTRSSPSTPFQDFNVQFTTIDPNPLPIAPAPREVTTSQQSVATPQHFAAQLTSEYDGGDWGEAASIYSIQFHLNVPHQYSL